MSYRDLREFIAQLEAKGELKRIRTAVSPRLEMTEICDRVLRAGGPALVFERPTGHDMPVLANLFGTVSRVAAAMGARDVAELREVGKLLAYLKEPEPPKGLRDLWDKFPVFKRVLDMAPKERSSPPCQEIVWQGADVDLAKLPVQTCWPQDAGPLITWGLTVTRGPRKSRQNLGIYRQQVIGRNRVIMRWLAHRGGALDFRDHAALSKDPFPVAVALGADPATMLAAVTPIPDTLGEYQFAGLLRGARTEVAKCMGSDLQVPASAEIVLEGAIHPSDVAEEGPHGDHTGYYNEVERFPVLTIDRITMRRSPIYHSTYTGKPPDEPAVLGAALNELFVPLLAKQFPEILDFYLPPEACSYRLAVVWAARLRNHRRFRKLVALKTVPRDLSATDARLEGMLLAEAAFASRIDHPNVCAIRDLGEHEGSLYVTMDWVDGETLASIEAERVTPLPIAVAARIAADVALALHAAHEMRDERGERLGLVHCDVSPQNILVSEAGVVKLVDFGVARATAVVEGQPAPAVNGILGGKLSFMSPEQTAGRPVDRRSDVFALGIVLYRLVTGRHPFPGESSYARFQSIRDYEREPSEPADLRPECPEELSDVIMRALRKEPVLRFQTADELASALAWAVPEIETAACRATLAEFARSAVGPSVQRRRRAIVEATRLADVRAGSLPELPLYVSGIDVPEHGFLPSTELVDDVEDEPAAPPGATERPVALSEAPSAPASSHAAARIGLMACAGIALGLVAAVAVPSGFGGRATPASAVRMADTPALGAVLGFAAARALEAATPAADDAAASAAEDDADQSSPSEDASAASLDTTAAVTRPAAMPIRVRLARAPGLSAVPRPLFPDPGF